MARCIYCQSDTCLYVNGTPICIASSDEIDAGRTPLTQPHETPSTTESEKTTTPVVAG
jgi:hypothetical protein